jgi:prophage DNA circulation protein
MMTLDHPDLTTEGMLWFPDLTQVGFSLEAVSEVLQLDSRSYMYREEVDALQQAAAPMSKYGVILPLTFWFVWNANMVNTVAGLSAFYLEVFAPKTYQTGVLGGKSEAAESIQKNMVRYISSATVQDVSVLHGNAVQPARHAHEPSDIG